MDKIDTLLSRRVDKVLPSKEGLKKLLKKKKIRLYQGFDPTATRLHLGHTVGLRKLMDFAELGHEVIFLFGTGTVLVGDPSLRDTGRKLITQDEIDQNIKTWKEQVASIVDFKKIKIMANGDWLTKLTLKDVINIASNITAVQLFKRESFQRRIDNGDTVWYHETMYPLLQGYDSVAMDVDLEVGGTDQEFNMLIGRELQKKMNNRDKFVLTTPMIAGTDGKPMSKTAGNCVWLTDTPNDMFGKLMGVLDSQIITYMEVVTNMPIKEVRKTQKDLESGELHPLEAKKILASEVVTELHSKEDAQKAQRYFEKTFQKRAPEFKREVGYKDNVLAIVSEEVGSKSEAKRLLSQNAIDINGTVITNPTHKISGGEKIKIGKKTFLTVKSK